MRVRSHVVVRAGRIAGGGRRHARSSAHRHPPLVSCRAGGKPPRLEGRGPGGPRAPAPGAAGRAGRSRRAHGFATESWTLLRMARVPRAPHGRAASPGPRLVLPSPVGPVAPTSDAASPRTGRGRDRAMEHLRWSREKNARCRRAWIIVADENGVLHRPIGRRRRAPAQSPARIDSTRPATGRACPSRRPWHSAGMAGAGTATSRSGGRTVSTISL